MSLREHVALRAQARRRAAEGWRVATRRRGAREGLRAKAQAASQSAQVLLERGDTDGAVNRAYYAVFGAARAALATVRVEPGHVQAARHDLPPL